MDFSDKSRYIIFGFMIGIMFGPILYHVTSTINVAGTTVDNINSAKVSCEKSLPRDQVCKLDIQFKVVKKEEANE